MIRLSELMKHELNEQDPAELDISYYTEQVLGLIETIAALKDEMEENLDAAYNSTNVPQYETMKNLASRYMIGAERQLNSLSKMLKRNEGFANGMNL